MENIHKITGIWLILKGHYTQLPYHCCVWAVVGRASTVLEHTQIFWLSMVSWLREMVLQFTSKNSAMLATAEWRERDNNTKLPDPPRLPYSHDSLDPKDSIHSHDSPDSESCNSPDSHDSPDSLDSLDSRNSLTPKTPLTPLTPMTPGRLGLEQSPLLLPLYCLYATNVNLDDMYIQCMICL